MEQSANLQRRPSRAYILRVPKDPQPERQFHVGEKLRVKLHDGRIVDATVTAITADEKQRTQLQVDFGYKDAETALIYSFQVCD